jgi:hypothetical protein
MKCLYITENNHNPYLKQNSPATDTETSTYISIDIDIYHLRALRAPGRLSTDHAKGIFCSILYILYRSIPWKYASICDVKVECRWQCKEGAVSLVSIKFSNLVLYVVITFMYIYSDAKL